MSFDAPPLDALIAEDLLFVGPDGRPATKSQDLEAHATGAARITRPAYGPAMTRGIGALWGDT